MVDDRRGRVLVEDNPVDQALGNVGAAPADEAQLVREVLDLDRLAELGQLGSAGSRSDFLRMLIDCFLTRAPAYLARLRAAVERGDATAVYSGAHGLKGAAATIGGPGVVEACQELEVLATTGALAPAREVLRRLEQELGRVTSALDVILSRW